MTKPQQKGETRVEVRLPWSGFPRRMYANRFRIERDEGFCILHFGLLAPSGLLLDHYCCVLHKETLAHNQATLVDYLKRIGQPESKTPEKWQPPANLHQTDVADIINMAHRNEMAEMAFVVFSFTAAHRLKPSASVDNTIDAQPLVLLRSSVELQKQVLVALYEEE